MHRLSQMTRCQVQFKVPKSRFYRFKTKNEKKKCCFENSSPTKKLRFETIDFAIDLTQKSLTNKDFAKEQSKEDNKTSFQKNIPVMNFVPLKIE